MAAVRVRRRVIWAVFCALGAHLGRRLGAAVMTRRRRPTSATSSRSSPDGARSATTRPSATTRTSRADSPSIRSRAILAGTTREKVVVAGAIGRERAACGGWLTRTRIDGCRCRTSRCRSSSRSWCGAGSTPGALRGVPVLAASRRRPAAKAVRPRPAALGPLARGRVADVTSSSRRRRSNRRKEGGAVRHAPNRAAAGGDGAGVSGRQPAAGGRDLRPGRALGPARRAARGRFGDIPGPVHALAFSRDGRRLAVGAGLPARSGVVRVYSVPDGTLIHDFAGHDDVVFAVALRPDGAQLASASFDQTVRLWNLGLGRPDGVFRGHSDFVYAVAYTPDGRTLLTAGKDRTIKRINARTLKEERTYSGHDDDVLARGRAPGWKAVRLGGQRAAAPLVEVGGRQAAGATGRAFRAGAAARFQRRRPALDLGRRRPHRAALGREDRRSRSGSSPAPPSGNTRPRSRTTAGWPRPAAGTAWSGSGTPTRAGCCATLVQPPHGRQPAPAISRRPTGWLAITPGGHVAGSPELDRRLVRWRAGGVALPAERCPSGLRSSRGRRARPCVAKPVSVVSFPIQEGEMSHGPRSLARRLAS